jgi:CHAT domain-containing protein
LISELSLISSPSLNVFISCSEAARVIPNTERETLIAIGNPSFRAEDFPGLPDLPDAAREAEGIANFYLSRKLIGPDATREKILAEIANAEVIHFAGHYLANDRDPMLSRFVLAEGLGTIGSEDGSLTVGELIARGLPRAKLVVLSACQTGAGKYYKGEGLISLSRAFLSTGIPLVVGSQWAVDSTATAQLMLKFHQYRSREGGLSTVAALRKAQLEMLSEPNGRYSAPYYWAAFLPMGGNADF